MRKLGSHNRRSKSRHHPRRKGQRIPYGIVTFSALLLVAFVLKSEQSPFANRGTISPSDQASRDEASRTDVYYPNCASARAAGVAPIHEGEPGYRPELDADGDGIACEPYRGY
jgi:hypothetical protein